MIPAKEFEGELWIRAADIHLLTKEKTREWVGLTDEEVKNYWDWEDFQCGCGRRTLLAMVLNIQAKLKEKNT